MWLEKKNVAKGSEYTGGDRYRRDWHFGDYDAGFVREAEFDCLAFGSTIRRRAELRLSGTKMALIYKLGGKL